MLSLYWIAFLVGGTFVALSLVGGGNGAGGHDVGGHDLAGDAGHGHDSGHGATYADSAVPGMADLLSLRFLFLFAAFFGLTGLALHYATGDSAAYTALVSTLVGLVVGLGGNVVLRRFANEHVSSEVTAADLVGRTGRVVVPMSGASRGQVRVVSKGSVVLLPARVVAGLETYAPGDEVVIVRMDGRTAEVVRMDPDPGADEGDSETTGTAPVRPRVRS